MARHTAATGSSISRPWRRRRYVGVSLRRAPASVGLLVAASVLLQACSAPGVAIDDDGFQACVAGTGTPIDDDAGDAAQLRFWAEPGTLDCAVDELDDEQRADALAPAFPDWSDLGPPDDGRQAEAQKTVIGDFVAEQLGDGGSSDDESSQALERATTVLRSLWVADVDSDAYARGMVDASVLSAMRAEGRLRGYDAYLAAHPDASDDVDELTGWYINTGGDDPAAERPTDSDRERHDELVDDMLAEVRG